MTILIVYGTNSGGTMSAGQGLADRLTPAGHQVILKAAPDAQAADLDKPDLIILGSCTWSGDVNGVSEGGQLQEHMAQLVERLQGYNGQGRRFAVYALGDSSYDTFCQAADHLEKFVASIHGTLIVPSLRIDRYYFDHDTNDAALTVWVTSINTALTKTS